MENVRRRVDVKTEHSDEKKDFQIDSKFFVSKGLTRARVPQKDLCLVTLHACAPSLTMLRQFSTTRYQPTFRRN